MLERKGVYIFGEIAKKISQNNSNIIFAMAGDGPELNKLKSLYSKYIDEIILIIEGYINNSEKCRSRDYIKDNHDWKKITKELRRQIV